MADGKGLQFFFNIIFDSTCDVAETSRNAKGILLSPILDKLHRDEVSWLLTPRAGWDGRAWQGIRLATYGKFYTNACVLVYALRTDELLAKVTTCYLWIVVHECLCTCVHTEN